MRLAWILGIAITLPSFGNAQVQLMPAAKEAALRASIPDIDDPVMARKIAEATLYTEVEMPLAYQFQPIAGGSGVDGTVFYSPYVRLNNIDPFTNGNREFPWRTPGGLDFAESHTDEFRFIWLPKQSNGQPQPVIVYLDKLEKSDSVNMPIPTGYRWLFPIGTVLGEVLVMNFSDGLKYTYEVRVRIRERDDWDVEIYRPFPTLASLKQRVSELDPDHPVLTQFDRQPLEQETLEDREHTRRAFKVSSATYKLPQLQSDLVKQLLTTTAFKSSMSESFARTATLTAFAPTAIHNESIVPPKYLGTFLGTDRDSCKNCHQHTLKHVDRFQNRDWYGYVRGSDGIFSFHPVEPGSIGPPDKPVRFRQQLANGGMIANYDPAVHPPSVYQIAAGFENRPMAKYPNTGRTTIRADY